jgi:hypothetical protein
MQGSWHPCVSQSGDLTMGGTQATSSVAPVAAGPTAAAARGRHATLTSHARGGPVSGMTGYMHDMNKRSLLYAIQSCRHSANRPQPSFGDKLPEPHHIPTRTQGPGRSISDFKGQHSGSKTACQDSTLTKTMQSKTILRTVVPWHPELLMASSLLVQTCQESKSSSCAAGGPEAV